MAVQCDEATVGTPPGVWAPIAGPLCVAGRDPGAQRKAHARSESLPAPSACLTPALNAGVQDDDASLTSS